MNISQPLAILVGAGPGLGLAVAKRFARENFAIALIARNKTALQSLVADLKQTTEKAFAFSANITAGDEVAIAFKQIHKQLGSAQVLIYNAASQFDLKGICEINVDNFIDSWKVNCLGGLLSAQQVLPDMVKQKHGTIIFTGATASIRGGARLASFACGKFSLRALAQSMAREFAPQGIHVVNVIIDGHIATPSALKHFPDRPLNTFLNPDAVAETYWQLYKQDQTTWTQELDLRPAVEKF